MQLADRGGAVYGALLFIVAISPFCARATGLPFWRCADCTAAGGAAGLGVARIGCFLAGCCWGTQTQLPLGIAFSSEVAHQLSGVPLHVKLHPTQLYESALVFLSIPLLRRVRRTRSFEGQVALVFTLYYAIIRFFLEFLRNDPRGSFFHGLLSTSQFVGLLLVPIVLFLLLSRSRKASLARESRGNRLTGARASKYREWQRTNWMSQPEPLVEGSSEVEQATNVN